MTSDPTRLSAAELADRLAAGELSSVEITQAHLDRIDAVDPKVHAYLHVDRDGALAQAAEAAGLRTAFYSVAEGGHDLGMMTAKTRSAEVLRSGVPASAVHATISWSAVASFLDAVLPR